MNNCDMFGCSQEIYNRITIGPGTNIGVCKDHYIELMKTLLPEDPAQYTK